MVQILKDAIQAKKVAHKAWLQNKADSSLHSLYDEARKLAPFTVKVHNAVIGELRTYSILDSNY